MSGGSVNGSLSPFFLLLSHQQCQHRHANNLSATPTSPDPVSSTVEGEEEEDTDFGAVMYITAVLVFYSLGIVVMIIKYLKTERKEMEEEMALENFFKGIPSKKLEHERDAVNRVAIQAFHTLTSGAGRPDQQPVAGKAGDGAWDGASDPHSQDRGKRDASASQDDSDSSGGLNSPSLPHRERSKYLPRVSLMFRDSRCGDRRKMQDNIRRQSGRPPVSEDSLSPHRSPRLTASYHPAENVQAGVCFDLPTEHFEHSDSSAASRTESSTVASESTNRKSPGAVTFEDERRPSGKYRSSDRAGGRPSCRPKSSRPSRGNLRTSTRSNDLPATSIPNDLSRCGSKASANTTRDNPVDVLSRPTAGFSGFPGYRSGSLTKVIAGGGNEADPTTVMVVPVKRLLVSDV